MKTHESSVIWCIILFLVTVSAIENNPDPFYRTVTSHEKEWNTLSNQGLISANNPINPQTTNLNNSQLFIEQIAPRNTRPPNTATLEYMQYNHGNYYDHRLPYYEWYKPSEKEQKKEKKEPEGYTAVNTISILGRFEVNGINFKRATITIKPNHYQDLEAKITIFEKQPIINYQTGGLKEVQKISCGVYKVDYSELNLTTESYISVSILSDSQMSYSLIVDNSGEKKSTIIKFYDLFSLVKGMDESQGHLESKEYGLRDPHGFFLHVKGY